MRKCRESLLIIIFENRDLLSFRISYEIMTNPVLFYLSSIFFLTICRGGLGEFKQGATSYSTVIQQNPSEKKLLLNGRIWRNEYSKVTGDQFFLTSTYLKGSVIYDGRRFDNLDLKYDIHNDELLLRIESYPVISMNKEMVDSFSLNFENRNYNIINAGTDTSGVLSGYVNVLYDGPSSLYVKYTKKIQPLAVDGKYDLFFQEHHVYLRKGSDIVPVEGKRKLLNLLEDKKEEVRDWLKSYRIKLRQKDPGTYIPVLEFYDSIRD